MEIREDNTTVRMELNAAPILTVEDLINYLSTVPKDWNVYIDGNYIKQVSKHNASAGEKISGYIILRDEET